MADITTIARPYAKGLFEHALSAKQLDAWSTMLQNLSGIVLHPDVEQVINNPAVTAEQKVELLTQLCRKLKGVKESKMLDNFVTLLVANNRLHVLPAISAQYEILRAEQEKTLTATVTSFIALTKTEQQHLVDALSQKLQRQVTLEMSIDETLLGGAVIRAGDLVIDGSVRGKLNKLGTNLVA